MIVVMKAGATAAQIGGVLARAEQLGFQSHPIYGEERVVITLVGNEAPVEATVFEQLDGVEKSTPITLPYKLASRDAHNHDTVIELGPDLRIGGPEVVLMAGPCAVESREGLLEIAHAVREAGAHILRGGAFKPRTSPYSFQGLGIKGLEILAEAREQTGLRIVTEVMAPEAVPIVAEYADILQIGARNMQNFKLLHAVGRVQRPVLLKRGLMNTIEELLMSAEYILAGGNYNVMLCERGIRTFEPYTRNTFDLSAIPALKQLSHLPVVADPSHGTGRWELVGPMSRAAVAAGCDALIIEVHPRPAEAVSDGAQSLKTKRFVHLVQQIARVAEAVDRKLAAPVSVTSNGRLA